LKHTHFRLQVEAEFSADADTRFYIGSTTKHMTALAAIVAPAIPPMAEPQADTRLADEA
jgi:hypothetical protein